MKENYQRIYLPAVSQGRQAIIEGGRLRRVVVKDFARKPMIIQTLNDSATFMLTGMVETKHPTIDQLIQIIPVHVRLLQAIHKAAGTKLPMTVGLITSARHPSPLRTPIIFGTSVCQCDFRDPYDKEVRRLNQADMRGRLEAMVGRRLPEAAGRCVEDHAFLGLEDALRQKLPMLSLVVGTKYLLNGSRAADDLLAASSNLEIQQFMDANRHWITFKMCPESVNASSFGEKCRQKLWI